MISCQVTPDDRLAEMLRKEIGITRDGQKRLVMEEGGIPVTLGLKVSNPIRTEGCQFGDRECLVKKGDCSTMGCIYCITCNKCKEELDIYKYQRNTFHPWWCEITTLHRNDHD